MELLAERGIDVSERTVLRWVQTFGLLLAAEVRKQRRPVGLRWYVDEMFVFRGTDKGYVYRAVDEHGQVIGILLRDHRDTDSARAVFHKTLGSAGQQPEEVITDHHQPYVKAVQEVLPTTKHVRTGLHRVHGETTKPIERSHVPTRDRLRASRGLKTLATGQRFLEGFEALRALRGGHVRLLDPVLNRALAAALGPHERARAIAVAVDLLGTRLTRRVPAVP